MSPNSTILDLTLPTGALGVGIQDRDSCCLVVSKINGASPLEVGDTIVSLNGIILNEIEGRMEAWETLFKTFSNVTRKVTVQRLGGIPTSNDVKRSDSSASIQEEKKDEYEPVVAAAPFPPTRKSSRKRISTTMIVDGHVIKR